jgi:hypothetical protein
LIDNLNKINSHETNPSQDSILNRVELENIPEGYVSVFHTTKPTALKSIDDFGLLTTKQSERIRRTQSYIDQYKNSINSRYIYDVENISRANCIYAFLNNDDFESSFGRGKDNILLEIKVDPKNCYVIDFELSTRILQTSMMRTSGMSSFTGDPYIYQDFEDYWSKVVSLEDYLQFYEDGVLIEDAPEGLPKYIETPEVIITKDVPQNHILLVNRP